MFCPVEPWSTAVERLHLTRPLPTGFAAREDGIDRTLPPGVWTTNGKRCTHGSGATTVVRGKPLWYVCQGGGFLFGAAHRNTALWTISYGVTARPKTFTRVGITDAWW